MHLVLQDGGRDVIYASELLSLLYTRKRRGGCVTLAKVTFISVRIFTFKEA